jgi:flagellar basal-body rod modification protein FlgD
MTVTPVSALTATPGAATAAATAEEVNALDKEAFLALLIASLRYQDPSEPMNTSELMAQTTQLSTMEQLTELSALSKQSFELQQRASAAGLVGRYVTVRDGAGQLSGLVSAVDLSSTIPAVVVDGRTVAVDAVTAIAAPPSTTPAV